MRREWIVELVKRVPAGAASRAWGWVARRERPRAAVGLLKRAFVAAAGIDLSEAAAGIDDFSSLHALFTRELKRGARPVDRARDAVVSPADGVVGACGRVDDGKLLQVKGRSYSLARLLGDEAAARGFAGGAYCTIYLSPHDYHRVHAPVDGVVREALVIPGRLMPVFAEAVMRVDELFARNERLITYVDSGSAGRVAIVMVGATLVGCVRAAYDADLRTNVAGRGVQRKRYEPARPLHKGDALGVFELGSTVVLVAEPGRLDLAQIGPGKIVRMGQRIGIIKSEGGAAVRAATGPANVDTARRGAAGHGKRPARKRGGSRER